MNYRNTSTDEGVSLLNRERLKVAHNKPIDEPLASLAPTKVLRRFASQNFGGLLAS